MTVAITGASGFLGTHLNHYLVSRGIRTRPLSQSISYSDFKLPSLANPNSDFTQCLSGASAIVHCAALAHRPKLSRDSLASQLFNTVNHLSAVKLAKDGLVCGIKRFIFISSIKVHGDTTKNNHELVPSSPYLPLGIYSLSKVQAELNLIKLAQESDLELVIIRPPLIHGSSPKGNISLLLRLIKAGVPLPIASSCAKRSFIHVDNLAATINYCLLAESPDLNIIIPSDCSPLYVTDFISYLAHSIGATAYLFPFPPPVFKLISNLSNHSTLYSSLFDDFMANHSFYRNQIPIQLPFSF